MGRKNGKEKVKQVKERKKQLGDGSQKRVMDKRGREVEGHAGAHHTMQGAQSGGTSNSLQISSNTHPRENLPLCSGGVTW